MDGSTLVEALHGKGINVRYLGKLAAMLTNVPQLQYLNRIAVSELILRSTKHIFTSYMQVLVFFVIDYCPFIFYALFIYIYRPSIQFDFNLFYSINGNFLKLHTIILTE